MPNQIEYAILEEYLNGSLSEAEIKILESSLALDSDLRQQLALYKKVRAAQQDPQHNNFSDTIKKVQQQYTEQQVSPKKPLNKFLWYVLGAIILLFALLFWWMKSTSSSPNIEPNKIYAEYAQHDFSLQEMSTDTTLGKIQELLRAKEYRLALPIIEQYLQTNPEAANVLLAKGIAQLETGTATEALSTFNSLGNLHPIYKNEANWYEALTYLKLGQIENCKSKLKAIPDNSSRFKDARTLLKTL